MASRISDSFSYCSNQELLETYIANLTSSYADRRNEGSMVSASIIMFALAGVFLLLNLFSGLSDVSAILDPKVRLVLSSALSLFLPVMSYLFSEAKNATAGGYYSSRSAAADLSLQAGLILLWMLLVELLRKKVDEIHMRGYSATIHRAGRVVWLGFLVFFNIKRVGRKAVFGIFWVLCATKVVQRIAFTEYGKRSYVHGKNARVITSYMAHKLEAADDHQDQISSVHVQLAGHGGRELLKRCEYIVMGEDKLVKEATADGYELNEPAADRRIVTVGDVWRLAESDRLFTTFDGDQRLRRMCLSFSLFKLLRRRFEHLPAMTKEEARDCRDLIFNGLYNNGDGKAAEALFQLINDEVNFLSEYYHSVVPVVLASPFFFLANYILLPFAVCGLCLMTIFLCGNGDISFTLSSIERDNYTLRCGLSKMTKILLTMALHSPQAFFTAVDMAISFILLIIFAYEEVWEFLVFLLSNWFMVSVLCDYTAKPQWRESPTFSGAFRRLLWLRGKMRRHVISFKQFSVLNLRLPPFLGLPSMLSLLLQTRPVPDKVKQSIMEYLVGHHHGGAGAGVDDTPLTNGKAALARNNLSHLSWASESESVAEVILTWHIATSLLEVMCPPAPGKEEAAVQSSRVVATSLSRYCAYLVAFHPELLPDNQDKVEQVFEDMKAELKKRLGCWEYYFWRRRARAEKILETTGVKAKAVVQNGATVAGSLMREVGENGAGAQVWRALADVWTELVVYAAPSSDEERVKGHESVLVQGGEFLTVLWALTTHTGIHRPPKSSPAAALPLLP